MGDYTENMTMGDYTENMTMEDYIENMAMVEKTENITTEKYKENINKDKYIEYITKDQYNDLKLLNKKNVKTFSLKNKIYIGKIVDVYDGDTCKIVINFKDEFFKFNVRMMGYDSPEIKTKNIIEKKYAQISKQILEKLILNKIVKIYCHEFDKYGRLLGIIIINNNKKEEININNFMVENHLGYSYFGDKKKDFNELLDYYKDIESKDIELKDIETINYEIIFNDNIFDNKIFNNSIDSDFDSNDEKNKCKCIIS